MENKIDHPKHYNSGIEAIEVIESWDLNFNRGNIIKYVLRAGKKNQELEIDDLMKAKWYLVRETKRIKKEKQKLINIDRQRRLDKLKWENSKKEGKDLSGCCDYCDFCKYSEEERKCTATQEEREQQTLCARAYNRMKKSRT